MNSDQLLKYISGELPDQEVREVYEWISSSEDNRAEYEALRRIYEISVWNAPRLGEAVSRKRRVFKVAAFALPLAAAICAFLLLFLKPAPSQTPLMSASFDKVTAPAGTDIHVELADGSAVWLNSCSTLRSVVDPSGATRRVYLEGEGYFEVAHDPEHPFIVETPTLAVKVKGTTFVVSAYPDSEWSASLIEGSVSVCNRQGDEYVELKPMTKASLRNGTLVVSSYNQDNALWKDGIIYFDNVTLDEIIHRISRYYDVSFDIRSKKHLGDRYSGKFRTVDGYDHILKVLRMDGRFDYSIRQSDSDITIIIK